MQHMFEVNDELMAAYAAILVSNPDPFRAALSQFPGEPGRALYYANEVYKTQEFQSILAEFKSKKPVIEEDEKEWAIALLKDMAEDAQGVAAKDRISALREIGEIKGWRKQTPEVTVNVVNKVMRIPAAMDVDTWESRAQKQQTNLVNVAETRH